MAFLLLVRVRSRRYKCADGFLIPGDAHHPDRLGECGRRTTVNPTAIFTTGGWPRQASAESGKKAAQESGGLARLRAHWRRPTNGRQDNVVASMNAFARDYVHPAKHDKGGVVMLSLFSLSIGARRH
jgi:hypothetical protein